MNRMRAMAVGIVASSALVCAALVVAQEQQTRPPGAALQHLQATETSRDSSVIGINVLKTVVTAELEYNARHGSFVSWKELYSAPELQKNWQPLHLSVGPEVVPGWALSLVAAADGQRFQVSMRNLADPCRLSFFSDQNTIIYEGGALDCSAPCAVQLVPSQN
ncbi:MAG: hypothetical protein WBE86_11015 [Candidatus Acidiferrales bacterium]